MAEGKRRNQAPKIPEEAMQHLWRELQKLGEPTLDVDQVGRYCYVTHAGSPLCRLGYRGEPEIWDFAIYKYSTQKYSTTEFLFPRSGPIVDLVRRALSAYNLDSEGSENF